MHVSFETPPSFDASDQSTALWVDGQWTRFYPEGLLDRLGNQPFLRHCRHGGGSLPLIRSFLLQHHCYAQHFTRYLCALMSNLTDAADVLTLARNLCEETGLDSEQGVTHAELFRSSVEALGAKPGDEPPLAETRALIEGMYRYCRSPDPLDGLSALCLGAEAIVPVVYGSVLTALRRLHAPPHATRFFELHVAEDEAHALAMRGIMNRLLESQPYRQRKVVAIAEEMVWLRVGMLDGIWNLHRGAVQ